MRPLSIGAATADTPAPEPLPAPVRIGADLYRFPVRWERIQPSGSGGLDRDAVAQLTRFLDSLIEAGTTPVLVLTRADLPPALARAGGWTNRATAEAFAGYAREMTRALGPRVALWTTFDEPPAGPPGTVDGLVAAHHLVVAHGLAATAIREEASDAQISISLPIRVTRPADDRDSGDLEAVRAVDLLRNHVFLGPLLDGSYPTELVAATRHLSDWSFVRGGDLVIARQRLDLLQVTYRDTAQVRRGTSGEVEEVVPPGRTSARIVDPQGLTDLLRSLDLVFPGIPLQVGIACPPAPDGAGDADRCSEYLADHLARIEQAVEDGLDVRGLLVLEPPVDGDAAVTDWFSGALARHGQARAAAEAEAMAAARARAEAARPGFLRRLLRKGT